MVSNLGILFWGLLYSSLTQSFNEVKARCGPVLFTDWMGKNHLCNKAFWKSLGSQRHLPCAMLSCNLSRLKTHLTKCKEGNALISGGKGQQWHEWLGALLGILIRGCLVLRFCKDFEAGNIRHKALDSWEFYLPEDIQLSCSCNFWIFPLPPFSSSLQSDRSCFVAEVYFISGPIGKHSWLWQRSPGQDDLRVEDEKELNMAAWFKITE